MKIVSTLVIASAFATLPVALQECGGTTSPDDDLDGWTVSGGDCNDADASVNPGAFDVPEDGVDGNCSGHSDYVTREAGSGTQGYTGDGGAATSAQIRNPFVTVSDAAGNLYIADSGNNRVRVVDADTGLISTIAGTGTASFSGDGGPATSATLNNPKGLAVDSAGNVYIADGGNQRIRKITASTGVISTIAGTGTAGFSGDGGSATAAQINWPYGMAIDSSGVLYFADSNNHRVRKISGGVISTVAGSGSAGFSGDGASATAAKLNFPRAVALAGSSFYIADTNNYRIRLVSGGLISTVAGNGVDGYGGDGGSPTLASLNDPHGLAIDDFGHVIIGDTGNNRIRMIIDGTIDTVVGTGAASSTGNDVENGAAKATVNTPYGVAVSAEGDLLITETTGATVRRVEW